MKWIDGYTNVEKVRRLEEWHPRFAWLPTCVDETPEHRKIYVWLVTMERKGEWHFACEYSFWTYIYREVLTGEPK